jgi:dTDP-4-dehydrorhamnose 3,5-epimerase
VKVFPGIVCSDVLVVEPVVHVDVRGSFRETWNEREFAAMTGLELRFVQDNQSSSGRGVLRGLHYQIDSPQGKLVRVVVGTVFDVVVDLRRSSATFGRWEGLELSAEDGRELWIPPGFAHGFLVRSDVAAVTYKTTAFYSPGGERTLLWNDPVLGIPWPLAADESPIVSAKDAAGVPFAMAETYT